MNPTDIHLNEEDIIRAVIDEKDLAQPVLDHLAECTECRNSVSSLARDLSGLGEMAESCAPKPKTPIRVPYPDSPKFRFSFLHLRPVFAGIAMVLVVAVAVWMTGPDTSVRTGPDMTARLATEAEADQQLISEVNQLMESALPDYWMEFTGESEVSLYNDEEFMEFLIPETTDSDGLEARIILHYV